jgi:hypothetical protein
VVLLCWGTWVDQDSQHETERTLVFIDDLCDRGQTAAVFALVQRLIESGRAVAVLGNHEDQHCIRPNPKMGGGFFF